MTLVKHELIRGRLPFLIWTGGIGLLLAVCLFLYPEMKGQMAGIQDMFSSMGALTAAFGMDRLNFGSLKGYYAIECGNVLGLGGAFFAALSGAAMLAKEEQDRSAEFLLTHPVSRRRILAEKLLALMIMITALNGIIFILAFCSISLIGESIPWQELSLLHLAYYLMQLVLAGICFGISAFLRRGSAGAGLGLAVMLYFLNLIANITPSVKFLKYFTPFSFCEGADIMTNSRLEGTYLIPGCAAGALGILIAFLKYERKDIR